MRIIESEKLLIDEKFTFDLSELTLTLEERNIIIDDYKGIRYLFSDKSEFEYKLFIKFFLNNCLLNDNSIYILFSDRFIERKDKIRSYQKLFYKEKSKIGSEYYKEIEIDLVDNNSIIVGVAKVEKNNLDYLAERLFFSDFTFSFGTSLEKEAILSDDFLKSIKDNSLIINSMRYFNPLKTVLHYKEHMDFAMSLQSFGNNDQSIEVIMKNDKVDEFLEIGKNYHKKNELISSN